MPTYRVKAPDGKTYRVQGPEGATEAQVRAQVMRQFPEAAGKKEKSFWQGAAESVIDAGSNFVSFLEQQPIAGVVPRATGVAVNSLLQGRAPTNAELANVFTLPGTVRAKPTLAPQLKQQRRDLSSASPYEGSTAGKITGAVAASIPTLGAGGPIAQGFAGGGLLTENPEDAGQVAFDAGVGAVTGKVADVVGRRVVAPAVTKTAKVTTNAVKAAIDATRKVAGGTAQSGTQAAVTRSANVAAQTADEALAPLGREAQMRAARLSRAGVQTPTTGMVTRDPTVWRTERELSKLNGVGDDLAQQIRGVDANLADTGRGIVDQVGGQVGPETTGLRVQTALQDKNKAMQAEIGALYRQAGEQFGDVPVPSLDSLWTRMADPTFRNNPEFGKMSSSVSGLLRDFGVINDAGANIPGASLSLRQAEELRKFINGLGGGDQTSIAGRKMLTDALDNDVLGAVQGLPDGQGYATARAAARQRFEEFKGTFPGKIVDEGVDPERLGKRILSESTSLADLRDLKKSLMTAKGGSQAWGSLRGQSVAQIVNSGITPDGAVNGTTIYNAFQKNADRLRILLSPQEYKAVRHFAYAARDATAEVPRSYVNNSNTASGLMNLFPQIQNEKQRSILTKLLRQGLAYVGLGPAGNVGLMVYDDIAAQAVKGQATRMAQGQAAIAVDPAAAAMALREAEQKAAADAANQQLLLRRQNFTGNALLRLAPPAVAVASDR